MRPGGRGAAHALLRFGLKDLARAGTMEGMVDAESVECARGTDRSPLSLSSVTSRRVADFFLCPDAPAGSGLFAAASIVVLCDVGSVYGASPVLFDGMVPPLSAVADAVGRVREERRRAEAGCERGNGAAAG